MRKRLWILHSWMGLIAGLVLLLVGVSGSLLVFHVEIERMLSPPRVRPAVPPGAARLTLDDLFERVHAQLPNDEIVGWMIAENPADLDDVNLQPRGECETNTRWILADPYTGRAFAATDTAGRKFVELLYDLHVSLFASDWGTVINGLFAVLLCLLAITGLWLYRDFWRHFFRLRWRAARRIFFSDLHKAVGISSVLFNLILGFTGAWWNLQALPGLFAKEEPAPSEAGEGAAPVRRFNPALTPDRLVFAARKAMPELRTERVLIGYPPYAEDEISVRGMVETRNPFRNHFGGEVTFDCETGALKKVRDIRKEPFWVQVEDTFMPLHFGNFGGLTIKILWCLGGLTPGGLAVSGFLIWRSRTRPRTKAAAGKPNPVH